MNFLNMPLAWMLELLSRLVNGSFAGAVFLFTLLINVILLPLNIRSQVSSVQQTRIKPKLDELKEKCGDDRQKYSMEMQKLYQDEGVKMSGGCLPMIIRLGIMMSIYTVILSPLTYMSGVEKTEIQNVTTVINESLDKLKKEDSEKFNKYLKELDWQEKSNSRSNELAIVSVVRDEHKLEVIEEFLSDEDYAKIEKDIKSIAAKDKESDIDYTLFSTKIDLTETPKFSVNIAKAFTPVWLMPIIAFLAQMLSSVLSMMMQKKINPEAPNMTGMMLSMPLISLFIGFALPGGVTFYWACSSLIGGFIQLGVQNFYGPHRMLARMRSKELTKQCDFEIDQIKKLTPADGE